MLLTQPDFKGSDSQPRKICHLKHYEITEEITPDLQIQSYTGPKKPSMPINHVCVPPLKILAQQSIRHARASNLDFQFLNTIVTDPSTPEFSGFNTQFMREHNQTPNPASKAVYTPLIDMTPSDPATIMTAMMEAQKLTKRTGQTFKIMTEDQQLYRVMINVLWAYPEMFTNFIPRLGGMHLLMSFVGSVGTLMAGSGLEEVLKSVFGGVSRMLTGKTFPQNIRALRMVVEEILHSTLDNADNYNYLMTILEVKATESKTTKLWVENLIKPVFIMMLFVRAEREADWILHLWAVSRMLPYFFAAGHVYYAWYGLYYLKSMRCLPSEVEEKFFKGEHVMRHNWAMEWHVV